MGDTTPDLGSTLADEAVGEEPRFGERYRVVRVLGHGGMGNVYLAVDEALGVEVALKRVVAPGDALVRLRDEVRLAQKVTHRNVCRTYDLEELDGEWLVKMEYVEGATLASRLPLSVPTAIHVGREICLGLAAAHREGVVHRDLKPQNVMIEERTGRVVLMDFGIARASELAGKTADHVSGTPGYMAPEQARGREVDARADLYALGRVLQEMLPGRAPKRLRRLVARLLEEDPARRPRSAEEVAAALAGGRRRWLWAVAALVVAAAAAGFALRPARRWQPQIRAFEPYWEDSDSPVFSPDGKQIAYFSDREQPTHYRLYVAAIDGGPPRAITPRELSPAAPRWTRDGQAILFADNLTGRLMRIDVAGGAAAPIADDANHGEDCGGPLVIAYGHTPDCSTCPRLAVREADGRERELIRFPAGSIVDNPRCDREGRRVLYSFAETTNTGSGARPFDLYLLPLDGGSPRRLTTDRALNGGTFAPDGRSVVFSAYHGGKLHIYELPLDGGPVTQLTSGPEGEMEPDVSPDGRLLLYQVSVGSFLLFEQPLAGGTPRKLNATVDHFFSHIAATADGKALIAQDVPLSMRKQIVRIPLDGGEPTVLADGESPALTPDGREIVYAVGDRVMTLPTAREVTRAPGWIHDMNAGADGRVHMQVARPDGEEAWSAPLAGGPAEREQPPPWCYVVPAPVGGWRAVIQLVSNGPNRVRLLPPGAALDDPGARELSGDGSVWTRDGRSFLSSRAGRVHRLFVETGEDRELGDTTMHVAVSADGQNLITTQDVVRTRRELITNFADRR